jgi:branched-chain amino acid transport system substrate-binding protein
MIRQLTTALLALWFVCAAQAADTIRVGTTQSLSGEYREFGQAQLNGLRMWVDDVNARGQLLGRRVELVARDDGSSASESKRLYGALIADGVDLLIGPYSSALTLAASEVAEQSGFPMVATAASAELIWERGFDNIFGIDTPSTNYMDVAVTEAVRRGAKRAALVYGEADFAKEVAGGLRRQARAQGLTLVMDEQYCPDTCDYPGLVSRMREAGTDVLFAASYLDDSVAIVRAMDDDDGYRPDMAVFTVGPALREFGDELGASAEGVVGVVQWLRSVRMPKAQDFAYRYRRKFGENPGVHAAIGYSAGQVIEAAVRLAGTTDHDALRAKLGEMRFRSLLGHYQVDDNGRQAGKRNYLLQWQSNERRLVAPDDLAERTLAFPMAKP